MEYIVGNISDAVVQDLAESNCEKEDIVTFYTNEIERINYYISSASLPSKIVIRGRFRFFSTHELEICREKHITLSLIIDSFSEKEIDLFLLLLCHSINFNCVFSCHILILLFTLLIQNTFDIFYKEKKSTEIQLNLNQDIYRQILSTDYKYFDDPEFYNNYTLTVNEYSNKSREAVNG